MRFSVVLALLSACATGSKFGGDTAVEYSDGTFGDSILGTTWVEINEGYCTVTEMPWGSYDEYVVVSPISNGPGSSDDQFYESDVGGLLEVNCDAFVTPNFDPQVTVDTSGCVKVYCDGVTASDDCPDRNDVYIYVYPSGAYGAGDQAEGCSLDATVGRG